MKRRMKLHRPRLNYKLIVAAILLAFGLLGVFKTQIVSAISSIMPDSTIGGTNWADKYLEISVSNSSNSLDAHTSYTKFYFRSNSGTIQIRDADFCGSAGSSPDGTTVLRNKYDLFRAGSDEKFNNLGSAVTSYTSVDRSTSPGHCEKDGNSLVTLNISGLQPSSLDGRNGIGGNAQYYVAVLRVSVASGSGVNAFKLGTPTSNGLVGHAVNSLAFNAGGFCDSYTSGNPCYNWGPFGSRKPSGDQDAFAVQDRKGANGSNSTFSFEFAPNCSLNGDKQIYLKWFDLDAGSANQIANPVMRLIRYPRNSTTGTVVQTKSSGWQTGSGNYEYWQVTVNSDYRYRWEWQNIQKTNGVQLWLPFDSANFAFGCPKPSSCSISSGTPSLVNTGESFDVGLGVYNGGDISPTTWPIDPVTANRFKFGFSHPSGSTNWGVSRANILGGTSTSVGKVLAAGQTGLNTASFTAPTTPGTYTIDVEILQENVKWTGIKCSKTVQVTNSSGAAECTINTSPALPNSVGVRQPFNVSMTVKNLSSQVWPAGDYALGSKGSPLNHFLATDLTDPNTGTTRVLPVSVAANGGTYTFAFQVAAPADPGVAQYFGWQMKRVGGTGFGTICTKNIDVLANKPLLRVEGSDLLSGAIIGNDCTVSPEVGIGRVDTNGRSLEDSVSQRYAGGAWPGYNGFSSGQYATFAAGGIGAGNDGDSYAANNGYIRTAGSDTRRDLLFANTGIDDEGYGNFYSNTSSDDGSISSALPCLDLSKLQSQSGEPYTVTSVPADGNTHYLLRSGAQSFGGSGYVLNARQRVVVVINGDATITGNITYADNYSPADAPMFMLIVNGNLTINPGVTRLDGYYIAARTAADPGNTGILKTCGDTSTPTTNVCTSQLKVNGALAAQQIIWNRNAGTLDGDTSTFATPAGGSRCAVNTRFSSYAAGSSNATVLDTSLIKALQDCAAENVSFSPELYFANPLSNQTQNAVSNVPDSTGELPPIY